MTKPLVSRTALRSFINVVFKHADPGTYVFLRAFGNDNRPYGNWQRIKLHERDRDKLIGAAIKLAEQCAIGEPEHPVFCPPIATFREGNGGRASTANLANGVVLTVECDTDAQEAHTTLETLLGPATLVVASGGKWIDEFGLEEDKLHLHWRLDKPTRTPEEHELLRQARVLAARIVGADLSAGPPVHPIRWPGSIHRKSTPRLCRIVEHSDAEINLIEALAWLEVEGPHYGVVVKGEAKGKGKVREPKGEAGEPNESLIGDIRDVRAALAAIPNDTLDYHWWNHMMMMIWGATGGCEEGRKAAHTYSKRIGKAYDPAFTDERWDHYKESPPTRVGIGSLIHLAREADPEFRTAREADDVDDVFEAKDGAAPALIKATPYEWVEPGTIPLRCWLSGEHLIRGYIGSTIAIGGGGKTTLLIIEALAMVTGRPLLGKSVPTEPLRVWLISTEDPLEELQRRVQAACIHYEITEADIGGRLFINAGRKAAVVVATEIREGVKIVAPKVDALKAEIKAMQIDVLMIDPLADFHQVNENDNKKIGEVMNVWADIAEDMDIAIEAAHHARKPASGADQTVSWADSRGAVTIINKSRDSRVMNRMSKKEAEKAGITNSRSYFSLISAKYNLIAPPENADWYKLTGERLGNGRDGGDNIGVIEPWEWQKSVVDITAEQRQEILTRISKHRYRAAQTAKDWVGKMVAEVLRNPLEKEADKTQVVTQLEILRTTHAIKTVEGKDEHRNTVLFVEVDQWVNDDQDVTYIQTPKKVICDYPRKAYAQVTRLRVCVGA